MTKRNGYCKIAMRQIRPVLRQRGRMLPDRQNAYRTWRLKDMFIIAGLGNPDKQYEGTRHNVGFDVIDRLADK